MWVQPRDYKAAGAVLRDARKATGLNQADLALRLSKPQSFVSSYESGQRRIDVLELLLICIALKCDPAAILKKISLQFPAVKPKAKKQ